MNRNLLSAYIVSWPQVTLRGIKHVSPRQKFQSLVVWTTGEVSDIKYCHSYPNTAKAAFPTQLLARVTMPAGQNYAFPDEENRDVPLARLHFV